MEMRYFVAFGLRLACNVPVAGPIPTPASDVDVEVCLQRLGERQREFPAEWMLHYRCPDLTSSGTPHLEVFRDGQSFHFFYSDGTRFQISAAGDQVRGWWTDETSLEDCAAYLLGPIMGFVLRLHGVLPLHASAIAAEGNAIAMVAPRGTGKSTLAAAFAELGYPILGDDVIALRPSAAAITASPAFPGVRLCSDVVETFYGEPGALPIAVGWQKHYLDLRSEGYRFQADPLPVGAIFVLQRTSGSKILRLEPLQGVAACRELLSNTYGNYLLDQEMRARELRSLAPLLAQARVLRAEIPDDRARVFEVCSAMKAEFPNLARSGAAGR